MKLLIAVDYFADPPLIGTSVIAYHWAPRLRERGHEVDLLVVREPFDPGLRQWLDRHGVGRAPVDVKLRPRLLRAWAPLAGIHPSLLHFDAGAVARQVRALGYDGVVIISHYLVGLAEALREHGRVVFVPTDSPSLEYEHRIGRFGGPLSQLRWRLERRLWARVERKRFPRLPAVVFVAPEDAARATRDWPAGARDGRVHVVPNGVDARAFAPGGAAAVPTELVFTGSLSPPGSVHGALWFIDRVLPRVAAAVPDVTFRMVGRRPDRELVRRAATDPRVEVDPDVPDLRPYLDRAGVYVCPLQIGAGTKNRLLEALAMGKAIVTTAPYAHALGLEHDTHLLIAGDEAEFADAVVALLRDDARRRRLGAAARRIAEERLTWEAGAARVEAMLAAP